jgi:type IV fimbrial biogenesis protein FimT
MKGFTLVEMIVTVALTAVLLTVGVPGFRDVVIGNQRSGISLDLYADLQLARSQAITRNQQVSICKSLDGMECAETSDWSSGWIVFANPAKLDDPATPESVLSTRERLAAPEFTLRPMGTPGRARFDFKPDGRSVQADALLLCHASPKITGRKIRLLASGAVMVSESSCP